MSVLLMFFIIVVIINKAFKLFKLVLVVYCDSCCHWWYPENSGNQKNVYNAKKTVTDTFYCVYIQEVSRFERSPLVWNYFVSSSGSALLSTAWLFAQKFLEILVRRKYYMHMRVLTAVRSRGIVTFTWRCIKAVAV